MNDELDIAPNDPDVARLTTLRNRLINAQNDANPRAAVPSDPTTPDPTPLTNPVPDEVRAALKHVLGQEFGDCPLTAEVQVGEGEGCAGPSRREGPARRPSTQPLTTVDPSSTTGDDPPSGDDEPPLDRHPFGGER